MSGKFVERCHLFRTLLKNNCLQVPGAFNGMTGRLCADNGYQALYLSGAAISGSNGVPDIGVLTLDQFTKQIKEVALASGLPLLADADTGFGEGEMVAKTVWEYFLNGASGLHIEDQVFPKRCGHLDGKQLVPIEDMVKKVQIAVKASQDCSDGAFIICARTDAKGVTGIEDTIIRSKAYVDAGADMIFPEGLGSAEEFAMVSKALEGYGPKGGPFLLANMTEWGKTPYMGVDVFAKLGYHLVIYPVSTFRVASKAIDLFLKELKTHGTQENYLDKMQPRQELYDTIKYTPGKEWYYPTDSNSANKK